MEQLFATFYPKTKKIDSSIPRSQQFNISAKQRSQSQMNKRNQSFSATRQKAWANANANTSGLRYAYNKENNKPKYSMNFEDFMIEKYEKVKKQNKSINDYALNKLQMRDINYAVNSYNDVDQQMSQEQNDMEEQQNSTFFSQKSQKNISHRNKLNNMNVDASDKINSTPTPQNIYKSNNNQFSDNFSQYKNDEEDYSPGGTKNSVHRNQNYISNNNSQNNNSQEYSQYLNSQNSKKTYNLTSQNNNQDYLSENDDNNRQDEESFEEFYVTLAHKDFEATKSNPGQLQNNFIPKYSMYQDNFGLNQDENKLKNKFEEYQEYIERIQNNEIQKSNKYPFFVTKINIKDQPNIYDIISDKKMRLTTEVSEESQSNNIPAFLRVFIKHDIHYTQKKNMRQALSAASRTNNTRQSTYVSQKRNNTNTNETAYTVMSTQPQEQIPHSYKNTNELQFRKNVKIYNRDNIGYNKQMQSFNQVYGNPTTENTRIQTANDTSFRKAKDFRITKSSQGHRATETQDLNLLERLKKYNDNNAPFSIQNNQNVQNNSRSPPKKNNTQSQQERTSDSKNEYYHNQVLSSSKLKSLISHHQNIEEFNPKLTVQKFLQKVKTPYQIINNQD